MSNKSSQLFSEYQKKETAKLRIVTMRTDFKHDDAINTLTAKLAIQLTTALIDIVILNLYRKYYYKFFCR